MKPTVQLVSEIDEFLGENALSECDCGCKCTKNFHDPECECECEKCKSAGKKKEATERPAIVKEIDEFLGEGTKREGKPSPFPIPPGPKRATPHLPAPSHSPPLSERFDEDTTSMNIPNTTARPSKGSKARANWRSFLKNQQGNYEKRVADKKAAADAPKTKTEALIDAIDDYLG